jgi:hypothetical protein
MRSIGREPAPVVWRKSSYSDGGGGDCVEVADGVPGAVPVRDSKRSAGAALLIPTSSWTAFIDGLKRVNRSRPPRSRASAMLSTGTRKPTSR